MAVISVEVDDRIAKQFAPYMIISSYKLVETIQKEEDNYEDRVLNFGAEGVSAREVLDFIKIQK